MLWKTHIRIANKILQELSIPRHSVEANYFRDGSIAPDRWKNYPHHEGKNGQIKQRILKAREAFIENDLSKALFNLGVALHYIQDYYTSLTSRSSHHNRWEHQIEQSYISDDLKGLVSRAFRDRPDRREEYTQYANILSKEVEGKEDTLRIATMSGPGLSIWWGRSYGKPHIDLNFAYKASLLIAKAVFGKKINGNLQTKMADILEIHKYRLKKTETLFAKEIIGLIKKKDDLLARKKQKGIIQKIKNGILGPKIWICNYQARKKLRDYERQKHLERVIEAYLAKVQSIIAPHRGWYRIIIPEIDINIVEEELLSLSEASKIFELQEHVIRYLIKKEEIPCYTIKKKEIVRKSELVKFFKG